MLDIKFIKDNLEFVKNRLAERTTDYSADLDKAVDLYLKRNEILYTVEKMKAKQNQVSKEVPKLKKEGKDVTSLMEEMKALSDEIRESDVKVQGIDADLEKILLNIPNIPSKSVPSGKDAEDNVEIRKFGTPRNFNFTPLPHWEIGANLGILDSERAAKVTGSRFHFYIGDGARLERAIISYFLDTHRKSGYTEIMPPFMVNRNSMRGTGQLPKFEEDAFKLDGYEYFMVPTAEVPVTNFHADEILMLDDDKPTISYCAYSANWRAEAGSAGRDTRGLIRQHQFNKVELVKFTTPENSCDELETLTKDAEKVLQGLGLAYRVVLLCTGDMGFSSAQTYDIEVYLPSYERYVEISSCSNFEDFQSRRANIRFKKTNKDKAKFAYTLNGSGVAVGRTTACILENYQNDDGSVTIPEALRPYMGGQEFIKKQ